LSVLVEAGDWEFGPLWLFDGREGGGCETGVGGNFDEADAGRGGAAPALGLPKNPARVVCLVLSCISTVSLMYEEGYGGREENDDRAQSSEGR
jgi:hypothetical protein